MPAANPHRPDRRSVQLGHDVGALAAGQLNQVQPDLVRNAGFVPLQVEAFVLVGLLLVGVLVAWFLFVEPAPADAP